MMQTARLVAFACGCAALFPAACGAQNAKPTPDAQAIVKRAFDFQQGDAASFSDAKSDFTSAGWDTFVAKFKGYLDAAGAPQFSSELSDLTLVSTSAADGETHAVYGGVLTYAGGPSRTAYRVKITVDYGGNPPRITALDYSTCAGSRTASSCP
ncbi:MAG TPA: hypothetical protein VNH64_03610 [Parvularculaceae bacterium]|nr:hypothetical protein [Parvularculaceae bacterium]